MIEMSVPACGYYGAMHGNRQLTCCYCSCNLFISLVTLISTIRWGVMWAASQSYCEGERNHVERRKCELWTGPGVDKYFMLAGSFVLVTLGCLAFWLSNHLNQYLVQDPTIS